MEAVAADDVVKLMWWLSHKADVNCESLDGLRNTPLHEAIRLRHVNMVAFLVEVSAR